MAIFTVTASSSFVVHVAVPDPVLVPWRKSASSSTTLRPAATATAIRQLPVAAVTTLIVTPAATELAFRLLPVSAASRFVTLATAAAPGPYARHVTATTSLIVTPGSSEVVRSPRPVAATTVLRVTPTATTGLSSLLRVDASSTIALVGIASTVGTIHVQASGLVTFQPGAAVIKSATGVAASTLAVVPSASSGRAIHVTAATGMGFSAGDAGSPRFSSTVAGSQYQVQVVAAAAVEGFVTTSRFTVRAYAMASVSLPGGTVVPGGGGVGPRSLLAVGLSAYPISFCETPSGLVLGANGVDPMVRWDAVRGSSGSAGLSPPATATYLAAFGLGLLVGRRYAFTRFLDGEGNPSNLSPISNEINLGHDAPIDDIRLDPATGVVTITSVGHALAPGDIVNFQNVGGLTAIAGTIQVQPTGEDTFTLAGFSLTQGTWTGGGSWTKGVLALVYTGVPVPTETRVARRQILRNLDGNLDVLYVDIDTEDLTSTDFLSDKADDVLAAGEPVPIVGPDDLPFANRYGVPPSHKRALAYFQGRVFAAGEIAVTEGSVRPAFGSTLMRGTATSWPASLAGRFLYVAGATHPYEIASVDVPAQVLTLASPFLEPTAPRYALYSILPAPGERKLVYFSEPGLVEAWPSWNAAELPSDSDEIVGPMVHASYLYILEQRHIYRWTMQGDPAKEGFLFLTAERGCVNPRCWAKAEGKAYLLDEQGIWSFDGREATPISMPVQDLFRGDEGVGGLRVDWSVDRRFWHAALDPRWDTIRWFVSMVGDSGLTHAICHDYRRGAWWVEQYPEPITSSSLGTLDGLRCMVGTAAGKVLCLGEGTLDGLEPVGTLRGSPTSATATTLTDTTAGFQAGLAGTPLAIVAGTGRDQVRTVASNTLDTLEVVTAWDTVPDATSVYQLGGIPWSWRGGWYEHVDDETTNTRDVDLTFRPTAGAAHLDLQLHYDHVEVPRAWSYSSRQDSVTVVAGQPQVEVDLRGLPVGQGYATFRQGGHSDPNAYGDTWVSVSLSGVQTHEKLAVYRVTLSGAEEPGNG